MSSKNVQAGVCQNIARTDTRSKIVSIDVDKKKLIENDFRIAQKQVKLGNSQHGINFGRSQKYDSISFLCSFAYK